MKNKKIVTKSTTFPISFVCYPYDENELITTFEKIQKDMPDVEYTYIFHYGENGDKNHFHCLMRNNCVKGFRDVQQLHKYFMHPCNEDIYIKDADGKDILRYSQGESVSFIALRQFIQTNSLGDWLEYVLHNPDYCEKKGL